MAIRWRILISVIAILGAAGSGWLGWWYSPGQRTRRLLKHTGPPIRTSEEITTEFRRILPSAVPHLLRALHDPDVDTRWLSARVLGWLKERQAVTALIGSLKDPAYLVRQSAAGALGEIGEMDAVGPLIESLDDESDDVSFVAARALGQLGSEEAVPPLIRALQEGGTDTRVHAARSLARLGDARAVEPLLSMLSWHDPWVRREAALALAKLGRAESVEALIAEYDRCAASQGHIRADILNALGHLRDSRTVPLFEKALADPCQDVRDAARQVLFDLRHKDE